MFLEVQRENENKIRKISSFSMYVLCGDVRVSLVVIHKQYAAAAFHVIPIHARVLGSKVTVDGNRHEMKIYAMNMVHDFALFKKINGHFDNVPQVYRPSILDKYITSVSNF